MSKIRLASPIQSDSIVDGQGIRTVIWTQGCIHNCKGCHNPQTHSFDGGELVEIEDLKQQILSIRQQDGVTLSGGEPILQIEQCLEISKFCQQNNLNVWCYTGYTFEELLKMSKKNESLLELLNNIDVLVDGKFIEEQKSLTLQFRGSKNQRILDLSRSLQENKAIEIERYKLIKKVDINAKGFEIDYNKFGKVQYMYI